MTGNAQSALRALDPVASGYSGAADLYGSQARNLSNQGYDATQDAANYLRRRFTANQRGSVLGAATANVGNHYLSAQSQGLSDLARRGAVGGSADAGYQAAMDASRAGALSSAYNDTNRYFDEQQRQNTLLLPQLLSGAGQQAFGNQMGALSGLTGVRQGQASGWSGLAQQQAAKEQADQAALYGLIGAGTSLIPGLRRGF